MADGEDFAIHGLLEHPFERIVAGAPEIRRHADPVDVHVDAERRGRDVVGEAEVRRNRHR